MLARFLKVISLAFATAARSPGGLRSSRMAEIADFPGFLEKVVQEKNYEGKRGSCPMPGRTSRYVRRNDVHAAAR